MVARALKRVVMLMGISHFEDQRMQIILTKILWPIWVILAYFRWNKNAVCEVQMIYPNFEFHDYPDGIIKEPMHGYEYTCERCKHKFYI